MMLYYVKAYFNFKAHKEFDNNKLFRELFVLENKYFQEVSLTFDSISKNINVIFDSAIDRFRFEEFIEKIAPITKENKATINVEYAIINNRSDKESLRSFGIVKINNNSWKKYSSKSLAKNIEM